MQSTAKSALVLKQLIKRHERGEIDEEEVILEMWAREPKFMAGLTVITLGAMMAARNMRTAA